ncbi:MAG: hypothetical protein JO372_10020 [Solirubrobacterales bacterium]|nr:hypothetical protein [Solirubrobacterales bacterium]
MSAIDHPLRTAAPGPQLRFAVQEASSLNYAAVPTLKFALRIEVAEAQPINAILLDVQIQIAARRRGYGSEEQERLLELFGTPERWRTTLRTLPWLRTTMVVPAFAGCTAVDLQVPCTYDLEVTAARYFAALEDGTVPLEFLFSGSVFFKTAAGALQTVRLGSDQETDFDLPIAVWRATMDRHFRGSAWLRLGDDSFKRLCAYKARHALPSFDAAIDSLIGSEATQ